MKKKTTSGGKRPSKKPGRPAKPLAKKTMPRSEINSIKLNIRSIKTELEGVKGLMFGGPSKSVKPNIPINLKLGFYDPYLSPSQRKSLKASAVKLLEQIDGFEARKCQFIYSAIKGSPVPLPLEWAPKNFEELIGRLGKEEFIRQGPTLAAYETYFADQHQKELRQLLTRALRLGERLLRLVGKK